MGTTAAVFPWESSTQARFLVLGPLSLSDGNEEVVLQPSRPTTLLAALLLHPNRVVPASFLHRAMWGDHLPTTAKASLQTYISRLRKLFASHNLPGNILETASPGYRLTISAERHDLVRFDQLVKLSETAPDPSSELDFLTKALALWRGQPLVNIDSDVLHREVVPLINERWLEVSERRFDLELAAGQYRHVIGDLQSAVALRPDHERFWEQLVEALYRSGRWTEALNTSIKAQQTLSATPGVALGRRLKRLEDTIRAGGSLDHAVEASDDNVVRDTVNKAVHHLPTDIPHFTGRTREIKSLLDHVRANRSGPAVVVLTGPPGIGKTALAVHVAHLLGDSFPDGRYSVPLGIQSYGSSKTRPAAVDNATTPCELVEAGRLLRIVDDAQSTTQVLPLLPTNHGAAVIVTSVTSLADLAISRGAMVMRLGPLEHSESYELLTALLGTERLDADPSAVNKLIQLCSGFPIALRIAATRLSLRPRLGISEYVDLLRTTPLTTFELHDTEKGSLARMISDAIGRLDDQAAEAFVKISASSETELTVETCALILGITANETGMILDQLVSANLIEEGKPGTYHTHELFRLITPCLAKASNAIHEKAEYLARITEHQTDRVTDWTCRNG